MQVGAFAEGLSELRAALIAIPGWVAAVLILAAAVTAALIAHYVLVEVVRRTRAFWHPTLYSMVVPLEGPLRLALTLLALGIAVAIAPVDVRLAGWLMDILQVSFIALVGWMVLTGVNIAAEVYIRRFQLQAADNIMARKQLTQARVLKGAAGTLIVVITIAAALMTFEQVRQYGVSLFASAGVAGLVVGLAARPVLSNLIAGVQLALTQPIRLADTVVVEKETGSVEEIYATYVVVRLWDQRRMIVPLSYFIEKPFENWTHRETGLVGAVTLRADYTVPVERLRAEVERIVKASPLWDGQTLNLQVTEADDRGVELRALVSAANSGRLWDLRCALREQLIGFLQREYPQALPRRRQEAVSLSAPPLPPSGPKAESQIPDRTG